MFGSAVEKKRPGAGQLRILRNLPVRKYYSVMMFIYTTYIQAF
jgi:hypothetical protein